MRFEIYSQNFLKVYIFVLQLHRLSLLVSGSYLGLSLCMPIAGILCETPVAGGWPLVFYVFGALGILWYVPWLFLVYDTPAKHPWISKEEREYIESTIGAANAKVHNKIWSYVCINVGLLNSFGMKDVTFRLQRCLCLIALNIRDKSKKLFSFTEEKIAHSLGRYSQDSRILGLRHDACWHRLELFRTNYVPSHIHERHSAFPHPQREYSTGFQQLYD